MDDVGEALTSFKAITGIEDDGVALDWLQLANFQTQTAIELFLASDGVLPGQEPPIGKRHQRSRDYEELDDEGRRIKADDVKRQRLIDIPDHGDSVLDYRQPQGLLVRHIDRRPRSVFGANGDFKPVTSKDETLQLMYSPPTSIMLHTDFQSARTIATQQRRWLIVNIQDNEEFACHILNRDVWKDGAVEDIIGAGFIFWQQLRVSPEGQAYIQRYHVKNYPYIAIIDPRTGAAMWERENKASLDIICDKLTDYLYNKPFPQGEEEGVQDIASSSSSSSAVDSKILPLPTEKSIPRSDANVTESSKPDAGPSSIGMKLNEAVSSSKDGFVVGELLHDDSQEDKSPPVVRLLIKLPKGRATQSFSINSDINSVAAFAARQLLNNGAGNDTVFELFTSFPRVSLSKERKNLQKVASNCPTPNCVSLSSLGIVSDTALTLEIIS